MLNMPHRAVHPFRIDVEPHLHLHLMNRTPSLRGSTIDIQHFETTGRIMISFEGETARSSVSQSFGRSVQRQGETLARGDDDTGWMNSLLLNSQCYVVFNFGLTCLALLRLASPRLNVFSVNKRALSSGSSTPTFLQECNDKQQPGITKPSKELQMYPLARPPWSASLTRPRPTFQFVRLLFQRKPPYSALGAGRNARMPMWLSSVLCY